MCWVINWASGRSTVKLWQVCCLTSTPEWAETTDTAATEWLKCSSLVEELTLVWIHQKMIKSKKIKYISTDVTGFNAENMHLFRDTITRGKCYNHIKNVSTVRTYMEVRRWRWMSQIWWCCLIASSGQSSVTVTTLYIVPDVSLVCNYLYFTMSGIGKGNKQQWLTSKNPAWHPTNVLPWSCKAQISVYQLCPSWVNIVSVLSQEFCHCTLKLVTLLDKECYFISPGAK